MKARRTQTGEEDRFDPWAAYSDLYCGLMLVFVLLLSFVVYRYLFRAETNQSETEKMQAAMIAQQEQVLLQYQASAEEQERQLAAQQSALAISQALVEDQQEELAAQSEELTAQQSALAVSQALVEDQQEELAAQSEELAAQSEELAAQQSALTQAQIQVQEQQQRLDLQTETLGAQADQLALQQDQLAAQQEELAQKEQRLSGQQEVIAAQQTALDDYARRIEEIVGVRGELIQSLNEHLRENGVLLQADEATGAIVFESELLFDYGSAELRESGVAFLRGFIPLYTQVLFSDEYRPYLAEIIVEGHTDDSGSYMYNLALSQDRALSVTALCTDDACDFLSKETVETLRQIITANGRAYSVPVCNADGSINPELSRRVEIKFRLKDQEMIDMLDKILGGQEERE